MLFNVNNTVRVKLTGTGLRIHRTNYEKFYASAKARGCSVPEYLPPKVDAEGWSTWQCWELMREFGEYLHNGFDPPFETTIDIEMPQDVLTFERSRQERTRAFTPEDWTARGVAFVAAAEFLQKQWWRENPKEQDQAKAIAGALIAEAKRCHRIVTLMEAKDARHPVT